MAVAPCHSHATRVPSTVREGDTEGESAIAASSRSADTIRLVLTQTVLSGAPGALLLTPPDHRRLPGGWGRGRSGRNKEEEGASQREILMEAEGGQI